VSEHPTDKAVIGAQQTLVALNAQAKAMRAELANLQRDLAQARDDFCSTPAALLLEANEQLVVSALRARTLADSALADLVALSRTSQYDELTETPNRALMLDRIQGAIGLARRHGKHVAVLFVDLDGFKFVNDTFGHAAGDAVLRRVASCLTDNVRETDTVSRFGGDEFLVLLASVNDASDAAVMAAKIIASLTSLGAGQDVASSVSASIGIAIYPEDASTPEELIQCADEAMYRAKRRGPGKLAFHADTERQSGLVGATSTPQRGPLSSDLSPQQAADLREANEHLVVSAVVAQTREGTAQLSHHRQIKFLAMVAHELRGPLMPLRTATELLPRAMSDEPLMGRLQVLIRRQVGYMTRLVEDLLDGARASTGKFRLERSRIDMNAILHQAVETCAPAMQQRQQQFIVHLLPTAFEVDGDAMRLVQVMVNLLDNASKYTPVNGRIHLETTLRDEKLRISVADSGIGVTAEAIPRIFDLFEQEPHARAFHAGGLGIGLSIVRELTEAHGGRIVASSPGQGLGSEFVVTLPRASPGKD
jgi:diguanylate cyclase (GGDEF)-like protein